MDDTDLGVLSLYFEMSTRPFRGFARLTRFVLPGGARLVEAARWRRAVVYLLHGLDFVLLRLPLLSSLAGVRVLKLVPRGRKTPSEYNAIPANGGQRLSLFVSLLGQPQPS